MNDSAIENAKAAWTKHREELCRNDPTARVCDTWFIAGYVEAATRFNVPDVHSIASEAVDAWEGYVRTHRDVWEMRQLGRTELAVATQQLQIRRVYCEGFRIACEDRSPAMSLAIRQPRSEPGTDPATEAARVEEVLTDLRAELAHAISAHGPVNSSHEGYGVICEEVQEFFDEVRSRAQGRHKRMRAELIQVAAAALRTIIDLNLPKGT